MKFICQRNYPHWLYITRTDCEGEELEKGKTTTVSTSGCGLCAAVMAADQLIPNCNFELSDALDLSYATNANHWLGTDYTRFAPAFCEKLNLRHQISHDIADVHNCLRTGGTVVVLVQGAREGHKLGLFSGSGHYINIIGYEPDGRFVILDPSHTPGKYDIPERKDKVEIKYNHLVICEEKYVIEELHLTKPPYYLFWRN